MKNIIITALIIWGALMLLPNLDKFLKEDGQSFEEYQKEHVLNNAKEGNSLVQYTGNVCAECGKKCVVGKEIKSNTGDEISYHQPYYLCGSMFCVDNRYQKDLKLQRSGNTSSNYNDNTRYSSGTDGRIHDAAPCEGCNGTGVESNYDDRGIIRETTCHYCNGTGHLSY